MSLLELFRGMIQREWRSQHSLILWGSVCLQCLVTVIIIIRKPESFLSNAPVKPVEIRAVERLFPVTFFLFWLPVSLFKAFCVWQSLKVYGICRRLRSSCLDCCSGSRSLSRLTHPTLLIAGAAERRTGSRSSGGHKCQQYHYENDSRLNVTDG